MPNGFNELSENLIKSLISKPTDPRALSNVCLEYDNASVPVSVYESSSV